MDEKLIARTIRTIRRRRKLSLQKLSSISGLSPGYLCKVERSEKAPPLSTLSKIALALDVDLSRLLMEESDVIEDVPLAIVRTDERKLIMTKGSLCGYQYESLAYNKPDKNMEVFIISPAFEERISFQHDAEEFMHVLEGVHEFVYGGEKYILRKGDSIYFDARIPHSGRSVGKKRAKILDVIYSYKKTPYPVQRMEEVKYEK
jgi:transcriptional regulator with XRE-family HTH domain